MIKKKISKAAFVLSIAAAFSILCGCGKEAENVTAEQPVAETAENAGSAMTEETPSSAPEEEKVTNELFLKGPSYTGLSPIDNINNEDGSYKYRDMTEDGITVITNMCSRNSQSDGQDPAAYAENFVCALVDDTGSAKIINSRDDMTLSEKLTYPSYRVYWEAGSNEDSRQNAGVVVLTDNFTFYYGYGCPKDSYEENSDFYESELDCIEWMDAGVSAESGTAAAETGENAGAEEGDGGYGPYLDKMNELKSEGLADQFTLAYINDDGSDIPELIASDSRGSFDHENAFIFTVNEGQVVEVAGVIAGVDGASLDYAIGANLIHISGAAAGMRDVFSRIENGKLEQVFAAEASDLDGDAKYTINGSSVKEEEYYKQLNEFMEPYNPLVRIAPDGLYEVNYTLNDGYGAFEQGNPEKYSR